VLGYFINDKYVWKKYCIIISGYFGDQVISIVNGKKVVDDMLRNSNC